MCRISEPASLTFPKLADGDRRTVDPERWRSEVIVMSSEAAGDGEVGASERFVNGARRFASRHKQESQDTPT